MTLSDTGLVRRTDPSPSHLAAAALDAGPVRWRVYGAIKRSGPAGQTWDEIHRRTRIPLDTISPRFIELVECGLIEKHYGSGGQELTRRAVYSDKQQTIWFDALPDASDEDSYREYLTRGKARNRRIRLKKAGISPQRAYEIVGHYLAVYDYPAGPWDLLDADQREAWQIIAEQINENH